jgi:hypothetical protein
MNRKFEHGIAQLLQSKNKYFRREKHMVTRKQAEDRVSAGFWSHLASYILVVGALAVVNYQRNPDNLWVLWVAGGWGIGIVAHALAYYTDRGKMIDRTVERMDRREQRQRRRESREIGSHITE